MRKRNREIALMVRRVGLRLLGITPSKGGHLRVETENKKGEGRIFFFSGSPSDDRGDKNNTSEMKRWAADQQGQPDDTK
jgi:hypothetical protein